MRTVSLIERLVVSITFFSYIPRLQNCSHIVSTNSIFVSLSNFERLIALFIVSSLLALKTIYKARKF